METPSRCTRDGDSFTVSPWEKNGIKHWSVNDKIRLEGSGDFMHPVRVVNVSTGDSVLASRG